MATDLTVRIEDRPGVWSGVWVPADDRGPDRKLGAIGIRVSRGVSLHGLTTAVVGKKFVVYLAFDTEADATYASTAMSKLGGRTRKPRRVPKARPRARNRLRKWRCSTDMWGR